MELVSGPERSIDAIARAGRVVHGHPNTREEMRAGLAMYFRGLADPILMTIAGKIAAALELDYFFNIQLIGDAVIEINPRLSTVVYQENLNLPYLGIKLALGEPSDSDVASYADLVRPSRRAMEVLRPSGVGRMMAPLRSPPQPGFARRSRPHAL